MNGDDRAAAVAAILEEAERPVRAGWTTGTYVANADGAMVDVRSGDTLRAARERPFEAPGTGGTA